MILYVAIILGLFFLTAKYAWRKPHEDYLGLDAIQPVKGVFILLVFVSHFVQYVHACGPYDQPYMRMKVLLGQMVVVPFLFYSGYGVVLSILSKGAAYVRGIPVRRILKTLFLFDTAVLLFVIVRKLIGFTYGWPQIGLSFLGWASVGNSNWYIFVIMILYALTFVSFFVFEKPGERGGAKPALISLTLLSILLISILTWCRPNYVYNTIIAYVAGGWYAAYREEAKRLLANNRFRIVAFIALTVAYFQCQMNWRNSLFLYELSAVIFALWIVLITTWARPRSRILAYCGRHLFSLYILQRMSMMLFARTPIAKHVYTFLIVSLAGTVLISWVFDFLMNPAWRFIEGRLNTGRSGK